VLRASAGTVATITAHHDEAGDRFYRAGAEPRCPGSGLGLAIVSQIAAVHQGTAIAASNHPRGLRVILTLPGWRWL
jgi:signal transduction histidine kinase